MTLPVLSWMDVGGGFTLAKPACQISVGVEARGKDHGKK